jgi:hypothetical protein
MTILTTRKIFGMIARHAVVGGKGVNAVLEMIMHLGMCEDNFTSRFFYVAASQTIHRLGVVVRDFFYVRVATFAAYACVGSLAEQLLVHEEETVITVFVHASQTSESMAHQTVLRVHGVQRLSE